MAKLGPDVQSGSTDAYSGYLANGNIWGFSMTHESGTGGAPKMGVVSQMPVVGNVSNPLVDLSQGRAAADEGQIGYYKSRLNNGVTVELSATDHAGLYQYTFPSGDASTIVVDVSHVLPSFRGLGWEQHYTKGNFSLFSDDHYEGSGTYNNGWNLCTYPRTLTCFHYKHHTDALQLLIGLYTSVDDSTRSLQTRRLSKEQAQLYLLTTKPPLLLAASVSAACSLSKTLP